MLMLYFITNNGYLITTTTMSLLGRNITEIVEYKLKEKLADFFATPRLVQQSAVWMVEVDSCSSTDSCFKRSSSNKSN